MKIPSAYLSGAYNPAGALGKNTKKADGGTENVKSPAQKQDSIVLSKNAESSKLAVKISADIRADAPSSEKIERLRNEVSAGTYNMNSEEIADAMLKTVFLGEA